MGRKDYCLIAEIIRTAPYLTNEQRRRLAADLAPVFKEDNDYFHTQQFVEACLDGDET